jgi:hypothetical protein
VAPELKEPTPTGVGGKLPQGGRFLDEAISQILATQRTVGSAMVCSGTFKGKYLPATQVLIPRRLHLVSYYGINGRGLRVACPFMVDSDL